MAPRPRLLSLVVFKEADRLALDQEEEGEEEATSDRGPRWMAEVEEDSPEL